MSDSRQPETLRIMTAMLAARDDWAGELLLGIGLRGPGLALALATLSLGAAGLFLEDDPAALRTAQRSGACTFVVSTLDEALRALKNELRQRRSITIGLSGDPKRWLADIAERGVFPQVVASEHLHPTVEQATNLVHGFGLAKLEEHSLDVETLLTQATQGWKTEDDEATTMLERRKQDATLLAATPGDAWTATAMRLWLSAAPTLFPRERNRAIWLRNS